MNAHAFGILCGLIGTSMGVWGTYTQWNRARTVGVEGVSLATWLFFSLTGMFWILYGIHEHNAIIICGSVIILPMQLSVTFRLRPWAHLATTARSVTVIGLLSALPTFLGGWSMGVAGTGISMVVNRIPQLIELITHDDVSGVSLVTWLSGVFGSIVWGTFYFTQHLRNAFLANVSVGIMNLTITSLVLWRHRRARYERAAADVY